MSVDIRAKMHQLMIETLADESKFHDWTYRAVRPMYVPPHWAPGQRVLGDCSKGCQYLTFWAQGPDPMGMNFGPYGNSATMCHHLQHLSDPRRLKTGDFITMGIAGSEHATCVIIADPIHGDPLLWSFGHQGTPNSYRRSQDRRPQQFLLNPVPTYVPTHADILRSKTGYFSWVAWKLGEGDWYGYDAANSKVRPNVPKLIPTVWWRHYALFLAGRKKGDKATTS